MQGVSNSDVFLQLHRDTQNQRPKYLKSFLGCRSLCFDPRTSILLHQLIQEVALHGRTACMFREH